MSMRERPYAIFGSLALGVFLIASIALATGAQWLVAGQSAAAAVRETIVNLLTQPIGTGIQFAPFALLAWMAASLAKERNLRAGAILFAAGALLLVPLYLWGYVASARAMRDKHWTAAALSIGFLPVFSVPILAVVAIARLAAGRKSRGD